MAGARTLCRWSYGLGAGCMYKALPAPGRSAQRPPGGDLRLLRDRKIATRLKRDGAESLGFCRRGCGRRQHSTPTKKYLFVFRDIDMKRVEGSSALIRRAHELHPL